MNELLRDLEKHMWNTQTSFLSFEHGTDCNHVYELKYNAQGEYFVYCDFRCVAVYSSAEKALEQLCVSSGMSETSLLEYLGY